MADDNARNVDRAWDLMKKIGFAMLVTRDGDKLRARPMSAYLERESNAIYFLTDARRHKDEEIARNPGCQPVVRQCQRPEIRFRHRHRRRLQRPRQDQGAVFDARQGMVGLGRGSQHPRAEDHAGRCRVLGFAGHRHQLCEDGGGGRHRHPSRDRRQPQGRDVMPIEPPEDPAGDAGQPDRTAAGKSAGKSAARGAAADARARRDAEAGGTAGTRRRMNCRCEDQTARVRPIPRQMPA